jgi:hypothetical protein
MYINLINFFEFEILLEREYDKGQPFELTIETKEMEAVGFSDVYRVSVFLNSLRKREPLLKSTTIHIHSSLHYNLLYALFTYFSRPLAIVRVIHGNELKTFYP